MANDGTVKIGTELDDSGFKSGLSKLGSVASTALKGTVAVVGGVATAASGAVAGLLSLESATEEYRIAQGKLNTAFEAAGYSAETAQKAYNGFYEILGDTDTATEASQLLAKLAKSQEDVATWTNIAAGVSGTFGDSLPIEGLIEAANETAKVGQVTGVLADALNWVGISEDDFNQKLASAADETERNQLIMETLSETYDEASDAFYKNNKAIVQSRQNQAKLESTMAKLGETVSNVKGNLISDFLPAISDITDAVSGMISGSENADEQFSQAMESLVNTAVSKLPSFLNFGVQIITSLLSGIVSSLPQLISAAPQIVITISSAIVALLPEVLAVGGEIISQIAAGIETGLPSLAGKLPLVINNILNYISDNLPNILQKGVEIVTSIANGIIQSIPNLVASLPEIITSILGFISENLPEIINAGITLVVNLASGLIQAIPQLVANIPQIIDAIVDGLLDGIPRIVDVGKRMVEGLWDGIKSLGSWIGDKVGGFFGGIVGGVKSFLGIHSPSTLFRDEIGKNIGLGVAKGLEDSEDDAIKAAKNLAESIYDESKNWIDKQVKYQEYGLREQLEVWESIRDQFIKESQQYADAEEQIYDLRQQIIQRNLELEQEYQDALEDKAKEIFNTYSLFDKIPNAEIVSGDELIKNLQGQVNVISNFYDKIETLSQRNGISQSLVNEIREMGPEAIDELNALLMLTDEKLAEYSNLYAEKQALANQYAKEELSSMRAETDAEIQKNINALEGIYEDESPKLGEAFTEGVAQGMEDNKQNVIDAAVSIAKEAVEAAKSVMSQFMPYASASVSSANSYMQPTTSQSFSTENALVKAASMLAIGQSSNYNRSLVLELNGREVARGIIPDIRAAEKQTPEISYV